MGGDLVIVSAGEAKRPRADLPNAARFMYLLPIVLYFLASLLMGFNINYMDESLYRPWSVHNQQGSFSPFIIIAKTTTLRGLPNFLNTCFILSAYTASNTALYVSSRTLFALAQQYGSPLIRNTLGKTNDGHTVTKSSELLPCNKSADNPVFASGLQNKSFVFTQVVNDTNPTFYYCGVPTHCEKGMFGVINPVMALPGAPTSLGGMMSSMAANDSDLSAYAAYSNNVTSGNNAASNWAANIDMSSLPEWSHSIVATNVLYSRAVLGMNPEVLKPDNSVDLSSVAATPLMLPMDITAPLNAATAQQAGAAPNDAGASPVGAAATSPAAAAPPTTSAPANGASSVASPRFLVAAVVVVATIFAL